MELKKGVQWVKDLSSEDLQVLEELPLSLYLPAFGKLGSKNLHKVHAITLAAWNLACVTVLPAHCQQDVLCLTMQQVACVLFIACRT